VVFVIAALFSPLAARYAALDQLQVALPPMVAARFDEAEPPTRQVKGEYFGEPHGINSWQSHSTHCLHFIRIISTRFSIKYSCERQ